MKYAKHLYIYSGLIVCLSGFSAQSVFGQGFDTGIAGIVEPISVKEPYGINSVAGTAMGSTPQGQSDYLTRSYRRGNESGIGSSFMQTNSPTNQSSPAKYRSEISPVVHEVAPMPKELKSIYGKLETTPALQAEEGI